jgi:hypothetical protein
MLQGIDIASEVPVSRPAVVALVESLNGLAPEWDPDATL